LESGRTANVTAKERSYRWTVVKEKGYGPKIRDCDGWTSLHRKLVTAISNQRSAKLRER
jgi:hypothetical protein